MGVYIKGITIEWLNTATQEEIADMLNRTDEMIEVAEPFSRENARESRESHETDCAWGKGEDHE